MGIYRKHSHLREEAREPHCTKHRTEWLPLEKGAAQRIWPQESPRPTHSHSISCPRSGHNGGTTWTRQNSVESHQWATRTVWRGECFGLMGVDGASTKCPPHIVPLEDREAKETGQVSKRNLAKGQWCPLGCWKLNLDAFILCNNFCKCF